MAGTAGSESWPPDRVQGGGQQLGFRSRGDEEQIAQWSVSAAVEAVDRVGDCNSHAGGAGRADAGLTLGTAREGIERRG